MGKLWRKKANFKRPDEIWGDITEILPYERLYEALTPEQLQELLRDAKRLHWRVLDLHRCGLDTLPPELCELTDLRILDLGNKNWGDDKFNDAKENAFLTLPDSFGNLSNLEWLFLDHTQISVLPDSFGNLSNLEWLSLEGSQISVLPVSFGNLSNLQRLWLDDTPLYEKLPPEIQHQLLSSLQEAIRYILEMQSNAPKRYFNETKMVVVGQGSIGKSCLINRLIHGKYENPHSTEGIDIEAWDFSGKDAGLDTQEEYRLNVWDFGGQEIYHATHQFFLTHRTLYILMWDALTEDEYGRPDYWMRTIRSFAGDSPVIIVVNKCDKDLGRYPQTEYAFLDKYPQILNRDHVFYISCRDNIGIDGLRDYILSEAVRMPLMKTEWLEKWLNIRKDLEELSGEENYIHYDEYLKICEKNGVTDKQEAQMLIQYLHDLGVVIHYHDDDLLCGIVILSPEWGTKAVYKILDEQQRTLKNRNGILYYEDLPKIWSDGKRYPKSMYPYLLKLMEKFQLAFPVNEHTYLVAELLNENPMLHDWPETGTEPLAFRYEYDFMPAGVMTRLIVSIHRYLEEINGVKQCWRKGAYLEYGSARAKLVLYDIDSKYLDIRVTGENARERSELLTIIREHVKGINSRFQKIEITEQVPCKCSGGCRHFFKYSTLLKAEDMKHPDVECPETLQRVSVEKLLDGIQMDNRQGDKKDEKPSIVEIWNQSADTLLKILKVIVILLVLLGV